MTGGLEMYPAYLSLANIVSKVCMKACSHAWMCFGFCPIIKFEVHPSFQSILSARLWHACMDKALAQCKEAAIAGHYMADPHSCLCQSFPLLAAWIADLPEQHLIAAVVNSTSPLSHAVTNQFGDTFCHPPCHDHETIKLIQDLSSRIDPCQLDEYQERGKELGLSGVHLLFWCDWFLADPFHFLMPEILHTCHKFFYDHPLQWCINVVGTVELDSHFKGLHPCVGSRHFSNSVSHVKQMTGREHCDIQRSIIAVIAGAVHPCFLRTIHAMIDFIYQVQLPFLSESAIASFADSLQEFHEEKMAITEAGACEGSKGSTISHFNIPKLEIWNHLTQSMRMMGAPFQWTTNVTERLHTTQVKITFCLTNHHSHFEEQCARILDRQERVRLFNSVCHFCVGGDPIFSGPVDATAPENVFTSQCPTQNYFLRSLVSPNSLAAFHVNKSPDIVSISIESAAHLYALPDLWPALGDFTCELSHQQRHGHWISRGCPNVGFDHIHAWHCFRLQLRSAHNQHVVVPAQTVQALPPSEEYPHGLCDTVLIHGCDAEDESVQGKSILLFCSISNII
jgi:hypothetical protein